jgi:hypothetical protein
LPNTDALNLDDAVKTIVKGHGGKVLSDRKLVFAGRSGHEFEAKTTKPHGYVSGRVMIVNGRYYAITAVGDHARLSNPEIMNFLQSFKSTK